MTMVGSIVVVGTDSGHAVTISVFDAFTIILSSVTMSETLLF